MIKNWTIYKITSPKGRVYIGRTMDYEKRVKMYKGNKCKPQRVLYNSLVKYGASHHVFEKIEEFVGSLSMVNDKEMFWVRSYMSNIYKFPEQNGLNLTNGGDGNVGMVASEATRAKLSLAKKGKPAYNKGKKMPPHQVEMLRKRMKGKNPLMGKTFSHLTEDARNKRFGAHNLGNSYNKGKKHSIEIVEARRERQIGKELVKKWKPVYQLDIQGNVLKEFPSIKAASLELKVKRGAIIAWCKGQRTPHFNQKWNFKYK